MVGSRSLLYATADRLSAGHPGATFAELARIDSRWGQPGIWAAMRHADGPLTRHHLLSALDRRLNADDAIVPVPPAPAVFANIYLPSLTISETGAPDCRALREPIHHQSASFPMRQATSTTECRWVV